ncbi:Clp protease N-terminal domain-containing protein [Leifsonia sp. Leaf264]|uniref:Clp protease N-terminal domain-containing protein n=1 Tax=Leifsonia sp. Leaf264 TaxID=1736314 RepID=UPI0007023A44|nr:Clp protease N-terminal domain-containing protein [Leifsonia sp. Leaf264]KQP01603.1 hypothetical protein ASF30_03135 [Leifsonia sp. Leaf264]
MNGGLAADARLVAEILATAEGEALSSGAPHIGAEHLVIGCLTASDPSARAALAADRVDDRAVRAALARVLDRAVLRASVDPIGEVDDPDSVVEGTPSLSADAAAVLARARVLSRSHRPRGLQSADVLVAVAEQRDGVAAEVLDDLGVDRQRLFDFRDWSAGR